MSDEELKLGVDDPQASLKAARTLLGRVALALKLATMHRLDNAAMGPPVAGLIAAVGAVLEGASAAAVQMVGENFFLNREIIPLDFSSFEAGQSLRGVFKRLHAQEIAFAAVPTTAEVLAFLAAFQRHYASATPEGLLGEPMGQISVRAISEAEENALKAELDERQNVVRAYAGLALTLDEQLTLLKAKKPARLARVRRAVHSLSDACAGHEALLVALTRFDGFAGEVRFHLAAVTALTLVMARRLGLPRALLTEACMAAAFHDLALDEAVVAAGETGSPERVGRVALRTILRLAEGALGGDALERIAVAHEHTRAAVEGQPVGFGALIAVPCVFDRLTRPDPPRQGLLPDHALRLIRDQAGQRFSPRVVELFTSVVGVFPIGSTVRLSGGELAIVLEVANDPALFARPRVKVVRTERGPCDVVVDLSAPEERRTIAATVDPSELQVNVPMFLLA